MKKRRTRMLAFMVTAFYFERDFEHSEPIDPKAWDDKSIWWRIGVQLSRLAAPVL